MSAPLSNSTPPAGRPSVRTEESPFFTSSPYEPSVPPIQRLEDIDLLDLELYHVGDPHAVWRLLREKAPVFWHSKGAVGTEGKGFWVLTRNEDVGRVYQDSTLFSSETGPFLDMRLEDTPRRILPSLDGADHKMLRGLVSPFFSRRALAVYTDSIRGTVTQLFDSVEARGTCDFSAEIAEKLPITATCNLLGISVSEAKSLADMVLVIDSPSPESMKKYNDAVLEFFKSAIDERRSSGANESIVDIVSNAQVDGQSVSKEDISHLLWVLFHGGIDSTVHAATGALLALFHHPEQLDILRKDLSLVERAVEEMLRWTAPSHANKRQVMQDVVIRGTRIKKGDYVSVWSPSANRDESAHEDPYRFDVRRAIKRPLATFGLGGKHHCIGEYFARLELKVLFEELFRRYPGVGQAGPAVRSSAYTMLISPITSLPISLGS
jgi:cytochrome P450